MDPRQARATPVPAQRFGDYLLLRKLAEGGMGEIFLAEKRAQVGDVAVRLVLKLMRRQISRDAKFVRMFFDEARLAARLSHPNVVQVFDFGVCDERYYLAMEYLAGESLDAIVRATLQHRRTIPTGVVTAIAAAVCDGLHYAHEFREDGQPMQVVHRDISPSNVMVTFQGGVKVLDFGIARAAARMQDSTDTGVIKGKMAYCAPELFRSDPVDRRADLFSLGVVLHELLTGRRLFRREDQYGTMMAVMQEPIPDLAELRPELPHGLCALVARALERDRDARFATALEMRRALDALMTGPPVRLDEYLVDLFGADEASERVELPTQPIITTIVETPRPAPEERAPERPPSAPPAPPRAAAPSRLQPRRVALAGLAALVIGGAAAYLTQRGPRRIAAIERLAQRGEHEKAYQLLQAYLVEHPDDADALTLGVLLEWWTRAPSIAPAVARARAGPLDERQRALVEGIDLVNAGRNGEAEQFLRDKLAREGDSAALRYALGEALWHGGRWQEGAEALADVVLRDASWQMALHHPVDHYLVMGDLARVDALIARTRPLDPVKALELESLTLLAKRDYDGAEKLLAGATTRHLDHAPLWARRAEATFLQGDFLRADSIAERAFQVWPIDQRGNGGISLRAEAFLYRGRTNEVASLVGAHMPLRILVEALWMGRGVEAAHPPFSGMLSPPWWTASSLDSAYAGRRRDEIALFDRYPEADMRAYARGLLAELDGERRAAVDAYRAALAAEQRGDARMLMAHHLARVLGALGDTAGAARACEEVLYPRVYRPYRAVLLPDCLLWTAAAHSEAPVRRQYYARLVDAWQGTFDHPAVVLARSRLAP